MLPSSSGNYEKMFLLRIRPDGISLIVVPLLFFTHCQDDTSTASARRLSSTLVDEFVTPGRYSGVAPVEALPER